MRKYSFLALALLISATSWAQFKQSTVKSYQVRNSNYVASSVKAGSPASVASIDTIWYDDLSDTTNWIYPGGQDEWSISDSLTTSLISQGFDDKLFSTSGGNFAIIDSDGSGNSGSQNAYLEYAYPINCSSDSAVQLVFETYLRQYQETREVFISGDNGVTWDSIEVLTEFGISTTSPNPYTASVDISDFAGGKSTVKLKFKYTGAFDWFWTIDDVRITTIPNHDLELTQEFYNGTTDNTYTNFYTMIPVKQADSAVINFGAEVFNQGNADQTNAFTSVEVNFNGTNVFSDTTDSVTIAKNDFHLFDFTNSFQPDSGLGVYNIRMEVVADSTDADPSNNVIEDQFEVSSYQYRRDNDVVTNDNWFDGNSWEMLVKYEIFTEDTVVALSVFFPYNFVTNRGLQEGDSISYYVYESSDLTTPVSTYLNYKLEQSDVNSWISLPMPAEKLEAGIYYVGFKIHTNSGSVGTNADINETTPPLTVLVRTNAIDDTDPWQYTTSFTPFVRMFTKTSNGCNGVNITMTFDVNDTTEYGSIETTVGGTGAAPYNYSWSGPNAFSANTKNIYDLEEQGLYVLTVTDVFGCTGVDTAVVAGTVSIIDFGQPQSFQVSPNPSNGHFYIQGEFDEKGLFQISVYNLVGQQVYGSQQILISNTKNLVSISDIETGVYVIRIESIQGDVQSQYIVIE